MLFPVPLKYIILLLLFILWSAQLNADSTISLTKDSLQAKINALTIKEGLSETEKTKILAIYKSAQDNLALLSKFNAHTDDFKRALKDAPDYIKLSKKTIEQTLLKQNQQDAEDFSKIPTEELMPRLIIENNKLNALNETIKNLSNELSTQQARPQLIRLETFKIEHDLEVSKTELENLLKTPSFNPENSARQSYLTTLLDADTAELNMLQAEGISNPMRIERLKLELQLLETKRNLLNLTINAIDSVLTATKLQQAKTVQEVLSQSEKELSGKNELLQAVTRENWQYVKDLQTTDDKTETYNDLKQTIDKQIIDIDEEFKTAAEKITLAGLSPPLGKLLHDQRHNLIYQDLFKLHSEIISHETANTNLGQLTVNERLTELGDINEILKQLMASKVDASLPVEQRMMIQAELRPLLIEQKELLNNLSMAHKRHLRALGDFDFASQQRHAKTEKFADYLDKNLLWVKNAEAINAQTFRDLNGSIRWLWSENHWFEVLEKTLNLPASHPFLSSFALLTSLLLLIYKNRFKGQLELIAQKVSKIYTDDFYYTLKALVYTLMLVLPMPLFLFYWGCLLSSGEIVGSFTKSVGIGLQYAAASWLFLNYFYKLFAVKGVINQHFQWSECNVQLLHQQLAWLRFIAIPASFVAHATMATDNPVYSDSLGRLALFISMIAIAIFWGYVLHPRRGLLSSFIADKPTGWVSKLRFFWYTALVASPFIIIGLAAAGYYSSALLLQEKLAEFLRFFFSVVLIHEIVMRWLKLANRHMAMLNARQNAVNNSDTAISDIENPELPIDEEFFDISKINAQTLSVLRLFIGFALLMGSWFIWRDMLPAFAFIDTIALWHHQVTLNNKITEEAITLANLLLAGFYVFIGIVAIRNFASVMEILVFRRFPITKGNRYAIEQLANYLLTSIAFLAVANELGGSWSEVQWLVAALSVGLGFGLQEIFANFVSGIILLFERPIRVGDTVTIGNVNGKVCRIHMRATTLLDADRKELIVPNKAFITSQLVNWSLSDAITRVTIPVGVAYGTDLELAHQLILATVIATPLILEEPAPMVLITDFADSAINFSIQVFVSEILNRMLVTHDLHLRLEKALREHDIKIPFPQRDVHIHTVAADVNSAAIAGV